MATTRLRAEPTLLGVDLHHDNTMHDPSKRLFALSVMETWNERVTLGLWTPEQYGQAVAGLVTHEASDEESLRAKG